MVADAKIRGLNIEDTHIIDPQKLDTSLVVIAVRATWAYRRVIRSMCRKAFLKKAHDRRQKSRFRKGLDALRKWMLHQPHQAIKA
ncbi:MAG: hypothetical protein ACJAZ1_002791 [Yoonia sp.]|jgi:hypothetical protein|tara:strand:- start:622 stop:876 length:255 start_codon:yes stop_codon:yes gene_type:complete